MATIQDSGQTLLRLLTDALDFSRADAGQLELAEDSFHLPGLLDDLSALWTARAELKGLSLDFRYDGALDQWALGDAVRVVPQVDRQPLGVADVGQWDAEVVAEVDCPFGEAGSDGLGH